MIGDKNGKKVSQKVLAKSEPVSVEISIGQLPEGAQDAGLFAVQVLFKSFKTREAADELAESVLADMERATGVRAFVTQ